MRSRLIAFLAVCLCAKAYQAAPARTVSLAVAGDFGVGPDADRTLAAMAAAKVDFSLALGDLSYNGEGSEQAWCDQTKARFPAGFPFEIVTGNHEDDFGGDGHIRKFAACLPDRLNARGDYGVQYYFDYANLVRVILISPDLTVDGKHYYYGADTEAYAWLSRVIDEGRAAGIPWIVVGMHKNCLSMGPYYCNIYQDLMNLLVEKKVDLTLHGHEHNYQRTHQLATGASCPLVEVDAFNPDCVVDDGRDGLYRKGVGLVSVIVGSGGGDLYELNADDPEAGYFAAAMGANQGPRKGFLRITLSVETLEGTFVGVTPAAGFEDTFTIARKP